MLRSQTRSLFSSVAAVVAVGLAVSACDRADSPADPTAIGQEVSEGHHQTVTTDPGTLSELAGVRKATARFQDLGEAMDAGFEQFSGHVPGMGIHYLTGSAIGSGGESTLDSNLDRTDPEILVYVDQAPRSPERNLVAVEYAIPMDQETPPQNAVDLFSGADASDWHVHPSSHSFPGLSNDWTLHGECHYQGGIGIFLAESPTGDFVLWSPPTGGFGSWSGTVEASECPTSLAGDPLPPLVIAHAKWWTLHAWVWYDNPEGIFHSTNPRVSG